MEKSNRIRFEFFLLLLLFLLSYSFYINFYLLDLNIRKKLVGEGIFPILLNFLSSDHSSILLHFLENLKEFFTLGKHQEEMAKSGILKKVIELCSDGKNEKIKQRSFNVLMYFDGKKKNHYILLFSLFFKNIFYFNVRIIYFILFYL